MGHWGQGKMGAHQAEETRGRRADRVPRPLRAAALRRRGDRRCATTSRPHDSRRCATCTRAGRRSAATCRSAFARRRRRSTCRRSPGGDAGRMPRETLARATRSSRRPWCSCGCSRSCCATPTLGQQHRADRRRRGAHLRHAGAVPPGRASTRSLGQLYEPEDRDELLYYKEAKDGQILEEGITEAGAIVVVDRGGDQLQRARRADAAVLHLLLDVRLPAHRRSHLARRPTRARAAS